jgi:hypothetical protein
MCRTIPGDVNFSGPFRPMPGLESRQKVFVKGKIFTFAAPANLRRDTRPYMDVQPSRDIGFQPTVEH